jgi:hypothetical protein
VYVCVVFICVSVYACVVHVLFLCECMRVCSWVVCLLLGTSQVAVSKVIIVVAY